LREALVNGKIGRGAAAGDRGAGDDDGADPSCLGPLQDLREIGGEGVVGQVGADVDEIVHGAMMPRRNGTRRP
jgi:hypothetical protein